MSEEQKENILLVRLASGEEVIGDVGMDDINIYAKNMVELVKVPNPNNPQQMGMGMLDFMPYAESIAFSRIGTHIAIPTEQLIRSYKQFTTGIALPDNQIQIATA